MTRREKATISIPKELKLRARAKAILEGKDLSKVIREFLAAWVDGKIDLPSEEPDKEGKS
jgi:hypothetical protein